MAILSLLILVALVAVILANLLMGTQAPTVNLIFRSYGNLPLGYVIAISAAAGALMMWLADISKHVSRFWTIRHLEAALAEKERAYQSLAHEAASSRAATAGTPAAPVGSSAVSQH